MPKAIKAWTTWTTSQIRLLKELWPRDDMTVADIAQRLDRTPTSTYSRGRLLNLGPRPRVLQGWAHGAMLADRDQVNVAQVGQKPDGCPASLHKEKAA